jgi:hypothetical protein
MARKTSIAGK